MNRPTRVLTFSLDADLLAPEDRRREPHFRQLRYCELLNQERCVLVLTAQPCRLTGDLGGGKVRVQAVVSTGFAAGSLRAWWRSLHLEGFVPDIVEYQCPLRCGLPALLAARRASVPLVGGVFNDLMDNAVWLKGRPLRRILNRLGRFVLSRTDAVRCDSRQTTETLRGKGFHRTRYVPFFVPWLDVFQVDDAVVDQRLTAWRERPTILCVARLSEEKNIGLLLHAFARAVSHGRPAILNVIGAGPEEQSLRALAAELGVANAVNWLGHVDYLELPPHYRRASGFALSSDSETNARVLVLAQTARLPTVATETSGADDIVVRDVTGFLTPIGDATRFGDRLHALINDEVTYRAMLYSDAFRALDQFGERMVETQLQDFYAQAISAACRQDSAA